MGAGLLAALAAMGAMAIAPDNRQDRPAGPDFSQAGAGSPSPVISRILVAAASTAAAFAVADDSDGALQVTAIEFAPFSKGQDFGAAGQLKLGVGLALAAYRQRDRDPMLDDVSRGENRTLGKLIPGYPQQARVTVGFKIAF